jgi:hypothetical protein
MIISFDTSPPTHLSGDASGLVAELARRLLRFETG